VVVTLVPNYLQHDDFVTAKVLPLNHQGIEKIPINLDQEIWAVVAEEVEVRLIYAFVQLLRYDSHGMVYKVTNNSPIHYSFSLVNCVY
jgi:hypothetical protein